MKWFKARGYKVLTTTGLKPGVGSRGFGINGISGLIDAEMNSA